MRDGNSPKTVKHIHEVLRFEPTYEGWKLRWLRTSWLASKSFEPTYEGWKHTGYAREAHWSIRF